VSILWTQQEFKMYSNIIILGSREMIMQTELSKY